MHNVIVYADRFTESVNVIHVTGSLRHWVIELSEGYDAEMIERGYTHSLIFPHDEWETEYASVPATDLARYVCRVGEALPSP